MAYAAGSTKIVESGAVEPSPEELKRKQAEILEKLRSVTVDQIEDFRGRSLETGRVDEVKAAWEKTIWAK
jgi:hypothetical protein